MDGGGSTRFSISNLLSYDMRIRVGASEAKQQIIVHSDGVFVVDLRDDGLKSLA
jgi:hypothetical protein